MRIKELSGLSEYVNEPLWDTRTMIFRGVSKSNFELIPAIGRPIFKGKDSYCHQQFEKEVLEDFIKRAYPHLSHEPRNLTEWLFLAQHYGIPTRLLDWTTSPLIALYFACEKDIEDECAVYKVVMENEFVRFDEIPDPFTITNIGLLEPFHKDIRYINQASAFTIHPNPTEAMNSPAIRKYIFKAEKKEEMKWLLRKNGISRTLIYPNLESIAQDIVEEHLPKLDGRKMRTYGDFLNW